MLPTFRGLEAPQLMENRIFLNRYRLSVGRSGSPVEMHRAPAARTFRGHEIDTGREIALTIVSPAPSETLLLEKLETEAIALEEVNHINIPRLYDFGREKEELIYVSEYWEGHTASAWVESRGPLTVAAVLRVASQVADAMNATVFQRLYHPALNPDNILFVAGQTGEGDWPPIKILNWHGPLPVLAQPVDARAESAGRFAAPEQMGESKVDVRSEIYSLGATMWFLLTGLPPASGDPDGLRVATSRLRGVPKIVRHLLERMVRPEPHERPQDPVALASYLQTCLARVERRSKMERRIGIPLVTQPRVVAPRTPMPGKRLAGALAVMLVAMLAIMFLTQSLISRPSAQITATTNQVSKDTPNESDLPNESNVSGAPTLAEKESNKETVASQAGSPPAAVAAAPSGSRGELVSISPLPATTPAATSAPQSEPALPDGLAEAESAPAASEPPPPAQGPARKDEPQVAYRSEGAPDEESSPNEMASGVAIGPPATQRNEPHSAVEVPRSEQLAETAVASEANALPTATPGKTLASTRKKSLRASSKTRLTKDRSRSARTVKRAQPLPKLRVGSAPAEYVGTTREGNWILVEATGDTIIVPPPPGYGP